MGQPSHCISKKEQVRALISIRDGDKGISVMNCVCQGTARKQNQSPTQTYIIRPLFQGWAHEVMEAERSHSGLSSRWRPRGAGGVILPEPEGPRTRSTDVPGRR